MKIIMGPTLKEFLVYLFNIFPCFLVMILFYLVIKCYSYKDFVVLLPIIACIVVLYTFFNEGNS